MERWVGGTDVEFQSGNGAVRNLLQPILALIALLEPLSMADDDEGLHALLDGVADELVAPQNIFEVPGYFFEMKGAAAGKASRSSEASPNLLFLSSRTAAVHDARAGTTLT